MNRSRQYALIAAMSLIAIVNAVVLAGVAYNRSGAPESALRLSERELSVPHGSPGSKENSGLSAHLQWRVLPPESLDPKEYAWGLYSHGASPDWLNEAKMVALGFEATATSNRIDGQRRADRQLPRDVLLVLELNGAAYQAALARAIKFNESTSADKRADKQVLKREEKQLSRLFVVDAGRDIAALRAKYPERSRYAIVRGQVRPAWGRDQPVAALTGQVSDVSVSTLNVPLEWKSVFDGTSATRARGGDAVVHYEVDVKFGRRLEPWIAGAARQQP